MKSDGYLDLEYALPQGATEPYSPESIGARIEALATKVGGKRELANRSGIHETQLYKYIKGANSPSIAVAVSLAQAGQVSLDWLILGVGNFSAAKQDQADNVADYAYVPLRRPLQHWSWRLERTLARLGKSVVHPLQLAQERPLAI